MVWVSREITLTITDVIYGHILQIYWLIFVFLMLQFPLAGACKLKCRPEWWGLRGVEVYSYHTKTGNIQINKNIRLTDKAFTSINCLFITPLWGMGWCLLYKNTCTRMLAFYDWRVWYQSFKYFICKTYVLNWGFHGQTDICMQHKHTHLLYCIYAYFYCF